MDVKIDYNLGFVFTANKNKISSFIASTKLRQCLDYVAVVFLMNSIHPGHIVNRKSSRNNSKNVQIRVFPW